MRGEFSFFRWVFFCVVSSLVFLTSGNESNPYIVGTNINLTYDASAFTNTSTVDLKLLYYNSNQILNSWIIGTFNNTGHIQTTPNLAYTTDQLLIPYSTTGNFVVASLTRNITYSLINIYQPLQIQNITSYTVSIGATYAAVIRLQSDLAAKLVNNSVSWMAEIITVEGQNWASNATAQVSAHPVHPTQFPTAVPTGKPTMAPIPKTPQPTMAPILNTPQPTMAPIPKTPQPTMAPVPSPTIATPTTTTASPTSRRTPTPKPTLLPTFRPIPLPTSAPTSVPTMPLPTAKPIGLPTIKPTLLPTTKPTLLPTFRPIPLPTSEPTRTPSQTSAPTLKPTLRPTVRPTGSPIAAPSSTPTSTTTQSPAQAPASPTAAPTTAPTKATSPTHRLPRRLQLKQLSDVLYEVSTQIPDDTSLLGPYSLLVGFSGMYQEETGTQKNMTFYTVLGAPNLNTKLLLYDNKDIDLQIERQNFTIAEPVQMSVNVGNQTMPLVVGLSPVEDPNTVFTLGCAPPYQAQDYNTFGWFSTNNNEMFFGVGNYSMGLYWYPSNEASGMLNMYSLTDTPLKIQILDTISSNLTLSTVMQNNSFMINGVSRASLTTGNNVTLNITTAFNTSTLLKYSIVQKINGTDEIAFNSSQKILHYDSSRGFDEVTIEVPETDEGLSTSEDLNTYLMFTAYDCADIPAIRNLIPSDVLSNSSSSSGNSLSVGAILGIVCAGVMVIGIATWWLYTKWRYGGSESVGYRSIEEDE